MSIQIILPSFFVLGIVAIALATAILARSAKAAAVYNTDLGFVKGIIGVGMALMIIYTTYGGVLVYIFLVK